MQFTITKKEYENFTHEEKINYNYLFSSWLETSYMFKAVKETQEAFEKLGKKSVDPRLEELENDIERYEELLNKIMAKLGA